jgi:hypothetical protein
MSFRSASVVTHRCFGAVKSRNSRRSLHLNQIFRTFGAASNKKLRTNLFQSTTWMLFGKSRRLIA